MKIIVTGALGHIGSKLIREMADWYPGISIQMIDNQSAQRYCSLFDLPKTAKYSLLESNVQDVDMRAMVKEADLVVHLAAITNAAGSFEIKERVEQENFEATRRVAEACADAGVKLVALSSTSVYGTQSSIVNESCSREDLKPQSPYAETKLREEEFVARLSRERNLKATILRFGTIFGVSPGMRFHTAVNKFCYQAAQGAPITVWRTAMNQVRPYLDLIDGVSAIKHIIEKEIFNGEIYNVVTLNTSVSAIVGEIEAKVGPVRVELVDAKIMNQLSFEVSGKKFEGTGFKMRGNLRVGIGETLDRLSGLWGNK